MKPAVRVLLLAVAFVCSEASPQKGSKGRCPANKSFGICVYNPDQNCLNDSACQGGQLCCPDGCNSVCKDPEMDEGSYNQGQQPNQPGMMVRHCPQPSGQFGICSYDENVNCLNDNECKNGQMCCSEGCNKVCKDPVTFQPMKPQAKNPMMFNNNGGRRQAY